MPPRSTPSSVTKNRIKRDYHTALAGFADWYFNIFPNGDNVAANCRKGKTLFDAHTPNTDFNPTGRFSSVVFFTSLALGLGQKDEGNTHIS